MDKIAYAIGLVAGLVLVFTNFQPPLADVVAGGIGGFLIGASGLRLFCD